ncbi:MAG: leucine-rich repeat protein [Clostridia bacterium]|nr:leucine-rich repeat protein [Clostridia bacterium]
MELKYVFISHSSKDKALTDRLCAYLGKNKVCYWYDGHLKGGNYAEQIGNKLIKASAYVLVASESALRSSEVQLEVEHMKGKLLVPLVLDDYYFQEDEGKGSITYTLGNNRIEAVIMNKYPSEEQAFARLVQLLQPAVMSWENDIGDFELANDGKKMLAYRGQDSFLSIPVPIEEIEMRAVQGNKDVEALQIGETVKIIGDSAFAGCRNLAQVSGMDSVTKCGKGAFAGTKIVESQKDIVLVGQVAVGGADADTLRIENCRVVADEAFFGNACKEIELCDGVEYIGQSAFCCCLDLEKVVLPKSIKEIGEKAFYDCFSLNEIICQGKAPVGLEKACQNISKINVKEMEI